MLDAAQLKLHAGRIRESRVLGRSSSMRRLFDFLVDCSLAGKAPKEIEIAIDVFDKGSSFEVTQDALVRVYIHKLRRKLEEYYLGPGRHETERLVIPKGEYRLIFEAAPLPAPVTVQNEPTPVARRQSRHWILVAVALVLTVANGIWAVTRPTTTPAANELTRIQTSPLWAPLFVDERPIYVVVGDYYLFGELDERSMQVRRLVREFDINSRNDLEQYLKNNPELADRYTDVSLQYLPIGAAFALQNVIPLLRLNDTGSRKVQIVLASDMTPNMVKSSHVIYIGLISGLRLLKELAFTGSQFKIGSSYDELVDRHTQRRYVSQAGSTPNGMKYQDFGYVSTFHGPSGNRIMIIAGTRDVALMHAAEVLTHSASLEQLTKRVGPRRDFEALYAVDAIDRLNLDGRLIFAGKLETQTPAGVPAPLSASQASAR
jgi:hypothetical protein